MHDDDDLAITIAWNRQAKNNTRDNTEPIPIINPKSIKSYSLSFKQISDVISYSPHGGWSCDICLQ